MMRVVPAVRVVTMIAHLVTMVSGTVYIPITEMPIVVVMASADPHAIRTNDYSIRHSRCCKCADAQGQY